MKAIVCDMCGNVNLLEDDRPYMFPSGVYQLISDNNSSVVDLCEVCAAKLMESVRKVKDGEDNA